MLGRTGAGESALLTILEQSEQGRVIRISPEHLALTYVANSTILNFFSTIGVNLDPFVKLLWRHVLTVEILTRHFQQGAETKPLLDRLRELFLGVSKHDKDMQLTCVALFGPVETSKNGALKGPTACGDQGHGG